MTILNQATNPFLAPDTTCSSKDVFGLKKDIKVPAYTKPNDYVPAVDEMYRFDEATTLSILAGFKHNRRVLVQGYHGTGKSTHIEQVAARLNWPCLRINLDGHLTRMDLIGRDGIAIENGKQVTVFKEGILPWALRVGCALILDEYDAGRPDVMFVIQRVLEAEGKLTLLDQNKIITPHPVFRLFATSNTVGLGDMTGMYHGTQQINQGQMDRWNIVATLNYLNKDVEVDIVAKKVPSIDKSIIKSMVSLATLTRSGFAAGDLSTVMSPRTVISWAENHVIFDDLRHSFDLSFANKCEESERVTLDEYYQRCFG